MIHYFDGLENMFGPLDSDLRSRLQAVIDNPTRDSWDHAYSIILSSKPRHLTLWQAVMRVDPTFPNIGPATDRNGVVLEDWARIPDRDLLQKAILFACNSGGAQ